MESGTEDGWTKVNGKRKRSNKQNAADDKHPRKYQKTNKTEEEEDDLMLNVVKPKPSVELKNPVQKKKQMKRNLQPNGISVRDLQNLILFVFDVGVNQNWIFLKVSVTSDQIYIFGNNLLI